MKKTSATGQSTRPKCWHQSEQEASGLVVVGCWLSFWVRGQFLYWTFLSFACENTSPSASYLGNPQFALYRANDANYDLVAA